MTKLATFAACYADWKLLKTRQTIQIIFEVKLEDHDRAYQALGGMPDPAREQWFGIAALDPSYTKEVMPDTKPTKPATHNWAEPHDKTLPDASTDKPMRRATNTMAMKAGRLCGDEMFWRFLEWRQRKTDAFINATVTKADTAAAIVRSICQVASRSEIQPGTPEGLAWQKLHDEFTVWRDAPDLVEREPIFSDCQS